jgi:hypothetical protein
MLYGHARGHEAGRGVRAELFVKEGAPAELA